MNEIVGSGTTVQAPSPRQGGQVEATSSANGSTLHDFVSATRHFRAEEMNAATYLQVFESLRQELSTRICGSAGLGAGYDALRLRELTSPQPGGRVKVTFTAIVCRAAPGRHLVEYVATSASRTCSGRTYVELAHGRAWTLHGPTGSTAAAVTESQP